MVVVLTRVPRLGPSPSPSGLRRHAFGIAMLFRMALASLSPQRSCSRNLLPGVEGAFPHSRSGRHNSSGDAVAPAPLHHLGWLLRDEGGAALPRAATLIPLQPIHGCHLSTSHGSSLRASPVDDMMSLIIVVDVATRSV